MKKLKKKIVNKIKYLISKYLFQTQLNGKFINTKGICLKKTRIGNTTFIQGIENLQIEDNVFIAPNSSIDATYGLTIKEGVQIGFFSLIATHSSHISIRLYGKEYGNVKDMIGYQTGPVYIGEYSFIGPHTVIMPNTKIGKGCIVSAFSFVKGEFPDFSIIQGIPAKIVGDTRDLDKKYLEEYPELKKYYNEWVNKN